MGCDSLRAVLVKGGEGGIMIMRLWAYECCPDCIQPF